MVLIGRRPRLVIIFAIVLCVTSRYTLDQTLKDLTKNSMISTAQNAAPESGGGSGVVDGGENYLMIDEPKNCRRRCVHQTGKVHYTEPTDGGLEDRIRLINAFLNLAAFLCADFYLQPPTDLLQPYHNGNQKLGSDLVWEDFLQAAWIDQGNNNPKYNLHTQNSTSFAAEAKGQSGTHVITADWWKVKGDFKRVNAASFRNETFTWEIRVTYWMLVGQQKETTLMGLDMILDDIVPQPLTRDEYLDMLPTESRFPSIEIESKERAFLAYISHGCTYVNLDYSPQIKLMQQSLENEIMSRRLYDLRNEDALIGLLHLRRGDTTSICDTSLEKVRSYLKCSLGGSEGIANITLVLTSEEIDEGWRESILGLASEFRGLTILDGDNITRGIIRNSVNSGDMRESMANGFVPFAVEGALRDTKSKWVSFRLARRRQHNCADCDPSVYQALDPSRRYHFKGDQLQMMPIGL